MTKPGAKPYLTTRNIEPENQETPIHFLRSDTIDYPYFYKRNHFPYPALTALHYFLPIIGLVDSPVLFSLRDIMNMPSKTIKAVLECSGNKRNLFEPKVFGEQWEKGAISQGTWKGVSLKTLLAASGIREEAAEVVIEGHDFGERKDLDNVYAYARSLPLNKALHPDTIIAYEYNGRPIPFKHGYPLRLIVPGWYAMASVKWIKQITFIDSKFAGPFQTIDYVYYPNKTNDEQAFPVTGIHVNSTIQKPLNMEILNTGTNVIKGIAWTGKGRITRVGISFDKGETWVDTELKNEHNAEYQWVSWSFTWFVTEKGEYTIMTRAADSCRRVQPMTPFWNRKGYGYNAIDTIKVKVE
ncbi:sulfite oxidase [Peribacillus deserti]|uniref:Sulfite oxidase n=1 Tax=Peribacillus deserti TaxID=673318 RepID=A0A2N5M5Y5_9BACI|nr:sulfite oxidase [Peribacillus deserti]PLT29703.1 sulfite oxidase [Peribacillus deserti]